MSNHMPGAHQAQHTFNMGRRKSEHIGGLGVRNLGDAFVLATLILHLENVTTVVAARALQQLSPARHYEQG